MAAPGTAAGSPLAYVGTFLLATAFYAVTAHVAARWVLGETPLRPAIGVGIAPAAVTVALLEVVHPLAVVALAVAVDAVALGLAYGESARTTSVLAAVHVVVSGALGIALLNLVGLLT